VIDAVRAKTNAADNVLEPDTDDDPLRVNADVKVELLLMPTDLLNAIAAVKVLVLLIEEATLDAEAVVPVADNVP
jgi:hypothetical protein